MMTPYSWTPFLGLEGLRKWQTEEQQKEAKIVKDGKQSSLVFLLSYLFTDNSKNDSIVSALPKELVTQILKCKTSLEEKDKESRTKSYVERRKKIIDNGAQIVTQDMIAHNKKKY